MRIKIFFTAILVFLFYCVIFSQKINIVPDTLAPSDLSVENTTKTPKDSCITLILVVSCGIPSHLYDTISICDEENIERYLRNGFMSKRGCGEEVAVKPAKVAQNMDVSVSLVNNRLAVSLPSGVQTADISVFDVRGKIILQKNAVKNNETLPLTNTNGVYFVRINYGKNVKIQKIAAHK